MDLRLPPLLNQAALFTRAATFGDTADLYYHSPSNRVGANYSPQTCGLLEKSKARAQAAVSTAVAPSASRSCAGTKQMRRKT